MGNGYRHDMGRSVIGDIILQCKEFPGRKKRRGGGNAYLQGVHVFVCILISKVENIMPF